MNRHRTRLRRGDNDRLDYVNLEEKIENIKLN